MFPIKDDNPVRSTPVVTYLLIVINLAVFAYEVFLSAQGRLDDFIYTFALIPRNVIHGKQLYTFITSMFLHAGFAHVSGNMLYIYIFGNNIEDIMGKKRFLGFYFLCGIAASMLQIAINPFSAVPNLGASGAIAGVLGAYLIKFPRARVHTVIFLGYFVRQVKLPAVVVLGFWFIIQLFSGIGSLAYASQDAGGVAFFAHIGGFTAGALLVNVFRRKR